MEGNNNTSKSTVKSEQHSNVWECHICIQLPTDPIAIPCGHIFCWPCIYQWLRDGPRSCPVCRTHLNKDRNILPLYNAGGDRPAGPSHGNSNDDDDVNNSGGDGSAVETAASENDVTIPPRPRNALLLGPGATARLEGSNSESASSHEAQEDSNSEPSLRDLVFGIIRETVALELSVSDLEQRNCNLRLEAQESEVRHRQETIKLVQHIGRLRRQIVRQDQMLGRANALLPPGWIDGI